MPIRRLNVRGGTVADSAKTRGCKCTICGKADNSPDPVTPEHSRLWASYKAKSGDVFALEYTTDGPHCWYCLRVYDSRYKTEYPKVANFVTKYVEVHAIHEQFTKYSAWLVQKILDWVEEGNDRELMCQLTWPQATQLDQLTIFETVWNLPPQRCVELKDYSHGDPATNGRGDKKIKGPGGVDLVELNEPRIWTKERKIISQARRTVTVVDQSDPLAADHADHQLKALGKQMMNGNFDLAASSACGSSCSGQPARGGPSPGKAPEVPGDSFGQQGAGVVDAAEAGGAKVEGDAEVKRRRRVGAPTEAAAKGGESGGAPAPPKRRQGKAKANATELAAVGDGVGAGGQAKKKRGRKPNEGDKMLTQGLKELKEAKLNAKKFYGAEWKNTKRNWDNYLASLSEQIEHEEDEGALERLELVQRSASCARKVLHAISLKGLESKEFAEIYAEQVEWLQQFRGATNPFPKILQQQATRAAGAHAWPPPRFWPLLSDSELSFLDQVDDFQVELFGEKILAIVHENTPDDMKAMLGELVAAFAPYADQFQSRKLPAEVETLQVIVRAPDYPPELSPEERAKKLGECLANFSTFHAGSALTAASKDEAARDRLRDLESAVKQHKDLTTKWQVTMELSPGALGEIGGLIKAMGSEAAEKVLTEEALTELKKKITGAVVEAIGHDPDKEIDQPKYENLSAFAKAMEEAVDVDWARPSVRFAEAGSLLSGALHTATLYDACKSAHEIHKDTAVKLASTLGDTAGLLFDLVEGCLGEAPRLGLCAWFEKAAKSEVGCKCMTEALASVAPALDSRKAVCRDFFGGTTEVVLKPDSDLSNYATFKIEGDLPKTLGVLNQIADRKLVSLELRFIEKFGDLVSACTKAYDARRKLNTRQERRMSESSVKEMTTVTMRLKELDAFMESVAKKGLTLFPAPVPQDGMEAFVKRPMSIGAVLNMGPFVATVAGFKEFLADATQAWLKDCLDMSNHVKSYVFAMTDQQKDSILSADLQGTLDSLVQPSQIQRCAKAASLLSVWRNWLKNLGVLTPGDFRDVGLTIDSLSQCSQFGAAARKIYIELPSVPNRVMRKRAAEAFKKENKVAVGSDLSRRLQALIEGEPAAAQQPPEAATEPATAA
ncbi:unnamed protein product [Prorocentrum cordatum]|uniref:Exocyst complex component Sec6 n=1 Tax=Prorocentrum cordatum TaxID=2364126 RepID=A0ABN9YH38_9DINO|nr:unnamed protein product [Polarella glacialis]